MSQRPTARSRSSFLSQPPASRPRPGRHGPTKARLPHAQNEVKDEPSQQRDAEPVLQQDAAPHSAFKSGPSSSRSQSPSEPLPESASRLPPAQALTPSSNSRNRVPTRSEQSEASMSMSISDGPSPPRTTAPPDWRFGQRRASVQPLSPTHILRSVACSDPFWQAGEDPSPPRKRADSIGGVPVDGRRPSVVPDALAQENPWQADSLCGSGDSETWVPSPPVFEQGQPLSTQVLQSDPERSSNDSTTAPITPELFPIPSLIGPNDLPYAHNPSGINAYVFVDTNLRFDSLIWPDSKAALVEMPTIEDRDVQPTVPKTAAQAMRSGRRPAPREAGLGVKPRLRRGQTAPFSNTGQQHILKGSEQMKHTLDPDRSPQFSRWGVRDQTLLTPVTCTPYAPFYLCPPPPFAAPGVAVRPMPSNMYDSQPTPWGTGTSHVVPSAMPSMWSPPPAQSPTAEPAPHERVTTAQMFASAAVTSFEATWTPPKFSNAIPHHALGMHPPGLGLQCSPLSRGTHFREPTAPVLMSPEQGRWVSNLTDDVGGPMFSPVRAENPDGQQPDASADDSGASVMDLLKQEFESFKLHSEKSHSTAHHNSENRSKGAEPKSGQPRVGPIGSKAYKAHTPLAAQPANDVFSEVPDATAREQTNNAGTSKRRPRHRSSRSGSTQKRSDPVQTWRRV